MDWKDWKPWYDGIAHELRLDPERDMEAAVLLKGLRGRGPDGARDIEKLIRGKHVLIFGPAPSSKGIATGNVTIAAGSAMDRLAEINLWPDIIVTDLDGDVPIQVEANRRGAIAVIHAHGDNMDALRKWVPEFRPPVICTTQVEPVEGVHNFGGFTDGDRAVFMALHFGADRITLRGFDFENPAVKPGGDPTRKMMKLDIARRLIRHACDICGVEIVLEQ